MGTSTILESRHVSTGDDDDDDVVACASVLASLAGRPPAPPAPAGQAGRQAPLPARKYLDWHKANIFAA